ncbi:PASTA domain-containing protein, partial [Pseudoscardovia suis]
PAHTPATPPATPPLPPAAPAHDRRHSARRLVVTVLLVLVLLAGCSAVWWFFSGPGSYRVLPAAQDVPCDASTASCTLTNANWDNYRALLDDEGIAYQVTERNDDSVPAGSIISTSPSLVGSHVSIRGGIVDVVVSQGAVQLTVPSDLLDASTADGKDPLAALAETGFTNVQHDESADQYSLTVPQGAAISVTPAPGSTVDHNTTVTVVLSKGLKPITFPDVVGKTRTEAESTLAPDNLTITWKQEYSDSVEEGTVISASAAAGDALHWGDSVTITVSQGPQMATVPDVVGNSYDDAEKTLTALGFKVEKKTTILGNWTDQVRQQSVDAGTSVRIHNTDGTPTVITLTVV